MVCKYLFRPFSIALVTCIVDAVLQSHSLLGPKPAHEFMSDICEEYSGRVRLLVSKEGPDISGRDILLVLNDGPGIRGRDVLLVSKEGPEISGRDILLVSKEGPEIRCEFSSASAKKIFDTGGGIGFGIGNANDD